VGIALPLRAPASFPSKMGAGALRCHRRSIYGIGAFHTFSIET
jgi:hypothetical protein